MTKLLGIGKATRPKNNRRKMTKKQKQFVIDCVENEGFEYTFVHYSSFGEIDDKKFHELREQFIAARKALADYVGVE